MKTRTFVSIHGGLGNQLFQLGFAQSLARKSEVTILPWKRNCRVDQKGKMWISHYEFSKEFIKNCGRTEHLLMNYARICHKIQLRASKGGFKGRTLNLVLILFTSIPRIFGIGIITTPNLGEFECPKLLRRNYVVVYFQTQKAAKYISKKIRNENKNWFTEIQTKTNHNAKILVLHVRRTDYKENPEIGLLPGMYFASALHLISDRFTWDELWLFSDDLMEAVELVPPEFRGKMRLIESNHLSPIEVLEMMSHGDAYVLSNSTFGWWAANLSDRNPNLVIVPQPWFRKIEEPKGLIPNDWFRVQA